jgi:hypothetical protein
LFRRRRFGQGTAWPGRALPFLTKERDMRSIIMLVLGVPIPLILLVAFCTHHL